jgi:SMODS-associating 2TM, beta-strand rich effector domain
MKRPQITLLVGLVFLIWAIIVVVQGSTVPLNYLKPVPTVISVMAFFLLLWERWLWSWWIFRPWLTTRPDLRGTWKGRLVSSWVDPTTHQSRGEVEAYLVVRQTFLTIDARLYTEESGSISLSASVVDDVPGLHTVAVVYRNTPRALLREQSQMGYGGMLLYVRGAPIHQLDGEYWTDRKTKGEITLRARSPHLFSDFEQARRAHYDSIAQATHA